MHVLPLSAQTKCFIYIRSAMFPAYVLLDGVDALPTLPAAVTNFSVLINDKMATADDFEQALKRDPVLTVNLLHAANGVHGNGLQPVATIREAIERVGTQQLFDAAIGNSLKRTLPARIPGYGTPTQKYWLHSIAAATIAEMLAKRTNLADADMAYTAGLLHDIGQLVIGGFLAVTMPAANWWTFDTPAKERSLLGSNHCDVGRELAISWNLPSAVEHTCRWHHELSTVPADVDKYLITVQHTADALAYMIGYPGVGYVGEVLDPRAPQRLGISTNDLYEAALELKETIEQHAMAAGMADPA
jgi:putative nucleotidyltransferase with HDIG domain